MPCQRGFFVVVFFLFLFAFYYYYYYYYNSWRFTFIIRQTLFTICVAYFISHSGKAVDNLITVCVNALITVKHRESLLKRNNYIDYRVLYHQKSI